MCLIPCGVPPQHVRLSGRLRITNVASRAKGGPLWQLSNTIELGTVLVLCDAQAVCMVAERAWTNCARGNWALDRCSRNTRHCITSSRLRLKIHTETHTFCTASRNKSTHTTNTSKLYARAKLQNIVVLSVNKPQYRHRPRNTSYLFETTYRHNITLVGRNQEFNTKCSGCTRENAATRRCYKADAKLQPLR
jgi:hypothetical protein